MSPSSSSSSSMSTSLFVVVVVIVASIQSNVASPTIKGKPITTTTTKNNHAKTKTTTISFYIDVIISILIGPKAKHNNAKKTYFVNKNISLERD